MHPNAAMSPVGSEDVEPLVIYATHDGDGMTYALSPRTRRRLREWLGEVARLRSRIFISNDTNAEYQDIHGPIRSQIVQLLTGLTEDRLSDLGPLHFRNATTDEDL